MATSIRQATPDDAPLLAALIRAAFRDVAERFGLTPENCPTHPSNCTEGWVRDAMARGVRCYVLEADGRPAGCVGLELADEEAAYLERLSVLPEFRRRGFGAALVAHVGQEARRLGRRRLQIALIADHRDLRHWYKKLGFRETGVRRFEHLPFDVLFMSLNLSLAGGAPASAQ